MRVLSVFCLFFLSLVYSMGRVTRQETHIYIRLYIILFQNMREHSCSCSVWSHVTSITLFELCHVTSIFWVMLCFESRDVATSCHEWSKKKNATWLSRMSNNVLSHVTSIIDDTCHMWVISRFKFFCFFFSRPFDMLTQCFETCLIRYRWDISYVSHVISIFIFVHSTSQCVHILTDLFFAGVVQSHSMIGVTNCKRLWRCV